MRATYRLLKVVMCLKTNQTSEYNKGVMASLCILEWMKANKHPVWQMLVDDPTMLLEEVGEISFSVLARCLTSSSVRKDCDRVSKMYMLTHTQLETAQKLRLDHEDKDDFLQNLHGETVKQDNATVAAVTAYFQLVMRQLKSKCFKTYPQGHKQKIKNAEAGANISVDLTTAPRVWLESKVAGIKPIHQNTKDNMTKFWATNHKELWPEVFAPPSNPPVANNPGAPARWDAKQRQAPPVRRDNDVIPGVRAVNPQGHQASRQLERRQRKRKATERKGRGANGRVAKKKGKRKKKKKKQSMAQDTDGDTVFENIPFSSGAESPDAYVPYRIMDEKKINGDQYYSIQWSGYPRQKDFSWELKTDYDSDSYNDLREFWELNRDDE
jgi:hypothetical protein